MGLTFMCIATIYNVPETQGTKTMTTRQATQKDFAQGTHLIDTAGNSFCILGKYAPGIWEVRGERGDKCVFEGEAKFYQVATS